MSIIYDALKKVEQAADKNAQEKIDKTDKPDKQDKKAKPNVQLYLIYILVICLGFITAYLAFGVFAKFTRAKNNAAKVKPARTVTQSPPTAKSVSPVSVAPAKETSKPAPVSIGKKLFPSIGEPKKHPANSFVLSGVFFSEKTGYALINNRIVKEGDTVSGALVVKIDLEEVELKSGEQTIHLSTQGR